MTTLEAAPQRPAAPARPRSRTATVLRGLDPATVVAVGWLVLIASAAVLVDVLPLPEAVDPGLALDQPVLASPGGSHLLGTDQYGLDILGQLVRGARVSLVVGLGGTVIGLVVGGAIGIVAGYFGGRVDGAIGVATDVLLSFPPLILLMTLASVLEPSTPSVALALGALAVPSYIRLARANTLRVAHADFITMSRAMGASDTRILARGIMPNLLPTLLSFGLLLMAVLIVAESSLSFLGLSVQPPEPTWGNMIAAAEPRFEEHPYLLVPALALFLTVFSVNRIGDHFAPEADRSGS